MLSDPNRSQEHSTRALELTRPFELVWESSGDPAMLREALRHADILVTENEVAITREMLVEAHRLKLIQVNGHSCRSVDVAAAAEAGIAVATLPLVTSESVAEHTIALMLALARRLLPGDRIVRAGASSAYGEPVKVTPERARYNWPELAGHKLLAGATLSILGLGDIGIGVAKRATALGMRVLYSQRHRLPAEEEARLSARFVDLEELLAAADWLSIHVRFSSETRALIGAPELGRLPRGACLINTARGPIVDEDALVAALSSGHLAGAGLDVFWVEPPPPDHPLYAFDNVFLTPHCAAGDLDNALSEVRQVFDELRRVWAGHPPSHPVRLAP